MPFLAPLLVTNSQNFKSASKVVLTFSLGRVFTYIVIAVIASSSSLLIKSTIKENNSFQIKTKINVLQAQYQNINQNQFLDIFQLVH
jgi:CHASE3 domain sensor protein